MDVKYSDKVKQKSDEYGLSLLKQATRQLEEVIGRSAERVSAEWDRVDDATGRTSFVLKVKDTTGEAQASFDPEELQRPISAKIRMHQVWGQLLQIRNHKLLQDLRDSGE